jgi:hypothetical protein
MLFYVEPTLEKDKDGTSMSEGDTFWVSLSEKFLGILLAVIGGLFLYFSLTTAALGGFTAFFGFLGVVVLVIGFFLIIVRPTE